MSTILRCLHYLAGCSQIHSEKNVSTCSQLHPEVNVSTGVSYDYRNKHAFFDKIPDGIFASKNAIGISSQKRRHFTLENLFSKMFIYKLNHHVVVHHVPVQLSITTDLTDQWERYIMLSRKYFVNCKMSTFLTTRDDSILEKNVAGIIRKKMLA